MVNDKNNRHFRAPCLVGAVSNCADAVRLETAPTVLLLGRRYFQLADAVRLETEPTGLD